jgi:hypothetical protein
MALDAPRTNQDAGLTTIKRLFGWVGQSGDVIAAFSAFRCTAE